VIRRLFPLGVIAVLLLGADVATRGFVSAAISDRAQRQAPSGATVSASVGGFPFLPPLVFGGRVDRASVHVENLSAKVVVFAEVDMTLVGVELDRGELIGDRKARITKIDRGTVRAVVTAESLSRALHVPVVMTPGRVTAAGVVVTPTVRNQRLAIGGLTIPPTRYMPCVSDVSVEDGRMELSCTIHDVPPALLDAAQRGL
jgi:hypothetical protein